MVPATDQATVCTTPPSPPRVTVKVNGVVAPAAPVPSGLLALVAAMENVVSSFRMVPVAVLVPMLPLLGVASTTWKPSFASPVLSRATLIVTVRLASPAAKLTVPDGSTPPAKSAALAGAAPLPVTLKATDPAPMVLPVRCARKVKAVVPLPLPSARAAKLAAIE